MAPGVPQETNNGWGGAPVPEPGDEGEFIPEQEEFLVREVATSGAYVFVPNSALQSNTVAMINGRDYSIRPIAVGLEPTVVRAAAVEGVGDVAWALCEGDATVAIIRVKAGGGVDGEDVRLVRVPREVNQVALSPDGRYLFAYIDPTRAPGGQGSVTSLQAAALIRLGDGEQPDRVFELSVTQLIRRVIFTEDSAQLFVVGKEGINRIYLDEVQRDALVAPLPLDFSGSLFPPLDFDVEVSPGGEFLVARSSDFKGVALYRPPSDAQAEALRVVTLSEAPTDIDLFVSAAGKPTVLATVRESEELALVDVEAAFAAAEDAPLTPTIVEVEAVKPGLAQLTPAGDEVLLYSTLPTLPNLGIMELGTQSLRVYPLRNQIRSLAVSRDSATAVVVHRKQPGSAPAGSDPMDYFQFHDGLTLVDLASGYRRALLLQGEPADVVVTQNTQDQGLVYVMQQSPRAEFQGVMRVNLKNYRTDFIRLGHQPEQMGVVAGKVFVSQASPQGRITFVDIDSGAQRTVSGYELNAGIQ